MTTAGHAGHSDMMREMIDGRTGDRHSPSGFYGAPDEEYRSAYLARVRGEIVTPDWWGLHHGARQTLDLTRATKRRLRHMRVCRADRQFGASGGTARCYARSLRGGLHNSRLAGCEPALVGRGCTRPFRGPQRSTDVCD